MSAVSAELFSKVHECAGDIGALVAAAREKGCEEAVLIVLAGALDDAATEAGFKLLARGRLKYVGELAGEIVFFCQGGD